MGLGQIQAAVWPMWLYYHFEIFFLTFCSIPATFSTIFICLLHVPTSLKSYFYFFILSPTALISSIHFDFSGATLWVTVPFDQYKIIIWQRSIILCLQTNLTRWIKWSFVQNTADEAPWTGFWTLCEYKLRKMVNKRCWGVTLGGITPTLRPISRMAPDFLIDLFSYFKESSILPI